MSFQAYLDNIKTKTGKTPDDFKKLAEEKGFLKNGVCVKTVKATEITNWLKPKIRIRNLLRQNLTSYLFQYSFFCPQCSNCCTCG